MNIIIDPQVDRHEAHTSAGADRRARETECARRQRIAIPGLVGGPVAFLLAMGLYAYAALGPAERAATATTLGTVCLLASIALLAWGAHFMDCSAKAPGGRTGLPGPRPGTPWDED